MRKLNYYISRNDLNQLYMSYVLQIIEYASIVWDGCSEQDLQRLQKSKMKQLGLLLDLLDLCHWKTCAKNVDGHLYQKEGININYHSCIMLILSWRFPTYKI